MQNYPNSAADNGNPFYNNVQNPNRHGADNRPRQTPPGNQQQRRDHYHPNNHPFITPSPKAAGPGASDHHQLTPPGEPPRPSGAADPAAVIAPEQSPFADSVTTAEAIRIYEQSGYPRSDRSIQRDCATGVLTSHKSYDQNGMTYYLIERGSISRHIDKLRTTLVMRPPRAPAFNPLTATRSTAVASTDSRASQGMQLMVAQLSSRLDDITAERQVLREQIAKKDEQIAALQSTQAASIGMIQSLQRLIDGLTGYLPKPNRNDEPITH